MRYRRADIGVFLCLLMGIISPTQASESPKQALDKDCHPSPSVLLPQYVVGYGSLIQRDSKNKTYPNTGENLPVLVSGFKRGWFTKGGSIGFSTTYLGLIEDVHAKLNGVIFKLPSAQVIAHYDKRELFYCRVPVQRAAIQMLTHTPVPPGQFWIYASTPESIAKPSDRYPIVQSYVDIFLSGCLEIEKQYHIKQFTEQCIATTSDWSTHWVNDRLYPRRPFIYQPNAGVIDALLANQLSDVFSSIKIE